MKHIAITGARSHNLKNVSINIPRDQISVITGVSGSGKSSLAFDTVFAEGQRRYVESLSSYARQFLQIMDKPDVDAIDGLSPTISIDQKTASHNPRSTVGTVTEIHDYLRLLYARIGDVYCPQHNIKLEAQTAGRIAELLLTQFSDQQMAILAPLIIERKGEHLEVFNTIAAAGFAKVRVDGVIYDIEEVPGLAKTVKHTIEIVVDRVRPRAGEKQRLIESLETAVKFSSGRVHVVPLDAPGTNAPTVFSTVHSCPECGYAPPELEPKLFSFNNPHSACSACEGLGTRSVLDPALVVEKPLLSLRAGAIKGWEEKNGYLFSLIQGVAELYSIDLDCPFAKLSKKQQEAILYGTGTKKIKSFYHQAHGEIVNIFKPFEGVINNLERRLADTPSKYVREEIMRFMSVNQCAVCHGDRLAPPALAVKVGGKGIHEISRLALDEVFEFFKKLKLDKTKAAISERIVREIRERVNFLVSVGLEYLSLGRTACTLSGGEAQRIRLASQVGSGLTGVTYVLDEPSIGLHQHDNKRLLSTLQRLRDLNNTVLIVEHDEEAIRTADNLIDLGPRAGVHGGEIIAAGPPAAIMECSHSLTGQYLTGAKKISVPATRRAFTDSLTVHGAAGNNLQGGDFGFPLGTFTCVTGVSGSGKSTLVNDILVRAVSRELGLVGKQPMQHKRISNIDKIEKIVVVDQSPIGRTPKSNPATYTGFFTPIRELFSKLPLARERGYSPGRFSFNVVGGRCEHCNGDGVMRIEMHFLPDVFVACEQCQGSRYNPETLEVKHKGKSIHDVLSMTAEDGLKFFADIPNIARRLRTLCDVGLGYIQLGQKATTLSGGEAQRVKLSLELSKRTAGGAFYVLDEPTTGLHFHDVAMLLKILHRFVEEGNTVVVIEHNLDVIKTADWIIDLGPKGGKQGGKLVAAGTPETLIKNKASVTGLHLKPMLARP